MKGADEREGGYTVRDALEQLALLILSAKVVTQLRVKGPGPRSHWPTHPWACGAQTLPQTPETWYRKVLHEQLTMVLTYPTRHLLACSSADLHIEKILTRLPGYYSTPVHSGRLAPVVVENLLAMLAPILRTGFAGFQRLVAS